MTEWEMDAATEAAMAATSERGSDRGSDEQSRAREWETAWGPSRVAVSRMGQVWGAELAPMTGGLLSEGATVDWLNLRNLKIIETVVRPLRFIERSQKRERDK